MRLASFFFFLPAIKSARIYLLAFCFGGSHGQKNGQKKQMVRAKSGQIAGKKKRIRYNGVRQD
jgi:hypothetical protein